MMMTPRDVLIQPTILPSICHTLRPCERKSLFISIGYIPSVRDKSRYFNVLDELFEDKEQIEYLIGNNTNIVIYGDNVPLISRPDRGNIGVGIHFYSCLRMQVDDIDVLDKEKIIERSFKTKEGRILDGIKNDAHISSNIDSYSDIYNQESLKMSYSHTGLIIASDRSNMTKRMITNLSIPGTRESQPIGFTLDILTELDYTPDAFSDDRTSSMYKHRYFETKYLIISKHSTRTGKMYIKTTEGQAYPKQGPRSISVLNTRDEHKRYISIPTRWIDHAIQ